MGFFKKIKEQIKKDVKRVSTYVTGGTALAAGLAATITTAYIVNTVRGDSNPADDFAFVKDVAVPVIVGAFGTAVAGGVVAIGSAYTHVKDLNKKSEKDAKKEAEKKHDKKIAVKYTNLEKLVQTGTEKRTLEVPANVYADSAIRCHGLCKALDCKIADMTEKPCVTFYERDTYAENKAKLDKVEEDAKKAKCVVIGDLYMSEAKRIAADVKNHARGTKITLRLKDSRYPVAQLHDYTGNDAKTETELRDGRYTPCGICTQTSGEYVLDEFGEKTTKTNWLQKLIVTLQKKTGIPTELKDILLKEAGEKDNKVQKVLRAVINQYPEWVEQKDAYDLQDAKHVLYINQQWKAAETVENNLFTKPQPAQPGQNLGLQYQTYQAPATQTAQKTTSVQGSAATPTPESIMQQNLNKINKQI